MTHLSWILFQVLYQTEQENIAERFNYLKLRKEQGTLLKRGKEQGKPYGRKPPEDLVDGGRRGVENGCWRVRISTTSK